VWKDAPFRSLADLQAREAIFGTTSVGTDSQVMPMLLNDLAGTKIRVIAGYKGVTDIFHAIEQQELQGASVLLSSCVASSQQQAPHSGYWDAKVETVVPNVAQGWDIQDGGNTIVIKLRKGMKWSDGQPFTADDIMFWYQDLYLNEELNKTKAAFMAIGGKQGTVQKIDDYAVAFKFDQPYYMFIDQIASLAVAGHMTEGWHAMGLWAPKHYMMQFHPKYADKAGIEEQAKAAGFDGWVSVEEASKTGEEGFRHAIPYALQLWVQAGGSQRSSTSSSVAWSIDSRSVASSRPGSRLHSASPRLPSRSAS